MVFEQVVGFPFLVIDFSLESSQDLLTAVLAALSDFFDSKQVYMWISTLHSIYFAKSSSRHRV